MRSLPTQASAFLTVESSSLHPDSKVKYSCDQFSRGLEQKAIHQAFFSELGKKPTLQKAWDPGTCSLRKAGRYHGFCQSLALGFYGSFFA